MAQLKYWDGSAWVDAVIGAQGTQGNNGTQGTDGEDHRLRISRVQ